MSGFTYSKPIHAGSSQFSASNSSLGPPPPDTFSLLLFCKTKHQSLKWTGIQATMPWSCSSPFDHHLISCLPHPEWQGKPVEVVVANVQVHLSDNYLRLEVTILPEPSKDLMKTSRTKTAILSTLFIIAVTGKLTWVHFANWHLFQIHSEWI